MNNFIIFFDDSCNFCSKCVLTLLKLDHKSKFLFAPLQGKTASKLLKEPLLKENTFILLENRGKNKEKIWLRGKAVLRSFWLLGGVYILIGWLVFSPFGIDTIYRFVAKHRKRIAVDDVSAKFKNYRGRFLP